MNESAFIRFVGVVRRPRTWLGVLYHWLAFPLGLFYFIFLVTGLSVGVGLVVIWVGIPILLVVAGAWWLFGAFERWQARVMLGADVPSSPREWEKVDGVWAKLRAHFGSGSTWKDLLYLLVKLPLGIGSFTLLVVAVSVVFWFFAMPVFAIADEPMVNGTWVPPLWFGILSVPIGVLALILALHVINGWSWVCARWAEVMFGTPAPAGLPAALPANAVAQAPPAGPPVAPPAGPPAAPSAPAPAAPPAAAVWQAPAVPPAAQQTPAQMPVPETAPASAPDAAAAPPDDQTAS